MLYITAAALPLRAEQTSTHGLSGDDGGYQLAFAGDRSLVVVGATFSAGTSAANGNAAVVSLDDQGFGIDASSRWIGTSSYDVATDVVALSAGGSIVVGSTTSTSTGQDAWLMKLDSGGNPVWQRKISGPYQDGLEAVALTSDESTLVAVGFYGTGASGLQRDAVVVTASVSTGVLQPTLFIPGSGFDTLNDVVRLAGGSFRAVGSSSTGTSHWDVWIVELEADGDFQASYKLRSGSTTHDEQGTGIRELPGGDLIVSGISHGGTWNQGCADALVFRLEPDGDPIWTTDVGGDLQDTALDLQHRADGTILFVGTHDATGFCGGSAVGNLWMAALADDGTLSWSSEFGVGGFLGIGRSAFDDVAAVGFEEVDSDQEVKVVHLGGCAQPENCADPQDTTATAATFSKVSDASRSTLETSVQGSVTSADDGELDFDSAFCRMPYWVRDREGLAFKTDADVARTPDGGAIVAGSFVDGSSNGRLVLFKFDAFGDLQWERSFAKVGMRHTIAVGIRPVAAGGYVICGWMEADENDRTAFLLQIDEDGLPSGFEGLLVQGELDNGRFIDVAQTADGGFVAVGDTYDDGDGNEPEPWIVKIDDAGAVVEASHGTVADWGQFRGVRAEDDMAVALGTHEGHLLVTAWDSDDLGHRWTTAIDGATGGGVAFDAAFRTGELGCVGQHDGRPTWFRVEDDGDLVTTSALQLSVGGAYNGIAGELGGLYYVTGEAWNDSVDGLLAGVAPDLVLTLQFYREYGNEPAVDEDHLTGAVLTDDSEFFGAGYSYSLSSTSDAVPWFLRLSGLGTTLASCDAVDEDEAPTVSSPTLSTVTDPAFDEDDVTVAGFDPSSEVACVELEQACP